MMNKNKSLLNISKVSLLVTSIITFLISIEYAIIANAMIITLPIQELVKKSDLILIAKVEQQTEIEVDKNQISTIKNVILPEKILKGSWNIKEPLTIFTKKCGEPGSIGWLEDQPELPPKGSKVLLFLYKADDGTYQPVNLVQGVWPINNDGKLLGMGYGYTLKQIQDCINQSK